MLTACRRIDKCAIPGQRLSDKFPTVGTDKMTNARGRMSRLGIDWVIKEWNAWRNHDRITRTTMLIYFFVIIEVQGQSFWWYNYGYDSTHTFFWSSRTVILILKKINLKVLYSVQFRNTERWYPKINWNAVFFSSFWRQFTQDANG